MPKQQKRFGPLKNVNKTNLGKVSEDKPGVYGIFGGAGNLEYLGRAKRGRAPERIVESTENVKDAGGKGKQFGFIPTPTVEDAKNLETRLIRKRDPRFNKEQKGK